MCLWVYPFGFSCPAETRRGGRCRSRWETRPAGQSVTAKMVADEFTQKVSGELFLFPTSPTRRERRYRRRNGDDQVDQGTTQRSSTSCGTAPTNRGGPSARAKDDKRDSTPVLLTKKMISLESCETFSAGCWRPSIGSLNPTHSTKYIGTWQCTDPLSVLLSKHHQFIWRETVVLFKRNWNRCITIQKDNCWQVSRAPNYGAAKQHQLFFVASEFVPMITVSISGVRERKGWTANDLSVFTFHL